MTMVIYRYDLTIMDAQGVELPYGAKILSVQFQYGVLRVWTLVQSGVNRMENVAFYILGTGNPVPKSFPPNAQFLDTVQQHDGRLVWHVFYRPPTWAD